MTDNLSPTGQEIWEEGPAETGRKQNMLKEIWRRLKENPVAMISLGIIVIYYLVALCADFIVPYTDCFTMSAANRLLPPGGDFPFGTDGFGRDLFARMIHGSRTSLTLGFYTATITIGAATLLGAACAYYGGLFDNIIMRICDIFMCIPGILLTLAMVAALGAGRTNMLIAISISSIPGSTRGFRSLMLNVMANDYIMAAKSYGSRDLRIIYKHVLPNVSAWIILSFMSSIPGMIMTVAGLSYLGMGITPPFPEWGVIIMEGRMHINSAPHLLYIPTIIMTILSMSFALLGDGLRDVFDPRLKR